MGSRRELAPCVHRGEQVDMRTTKRACCGQRKRLEYKYACAMGLEAWETECRQCKQIEAPFS